MVICINFIERIKRLQPVPQVADRIIRLMCEGDCDLHRLTEIISFDASMTANIIRMANSAWFGRSSPCETLRQAVVFLGTDRLMQMALMSACGENFKGSQPGYCLENDRLWRYSVCSALVAKNLSARKGVGDKNMIYTAALLKDIGKVVMCQNVAEQFDRIDAAIREEGRDFMEAEREVIGIDHAQLGGMVLRTWRFSEAMVTIVENHHNPGNAGAYIAETAVVYLGDILCMMAGVSDGADGLAYTFYQDVIEGLGVTPAEMQEIMAEIPGWVAMVTALGGGEGGRCQPVGTASS